MNKAIGMNRNAHIGMNRNAQLIGERKLFCTPIFKRYAVGVDTNGGLEIRLNKNAIKKGEVEEIKDLALSACDEAKVKYDETKFRAALSDLQDRMMDKKAKLVEFEGKKPVFAAIIAPILEYMREKLDLGVMYIGDYFRSHDLAKQ